jgi:predicted ATP-grasp superfamily ATP-dependent carboligase
VLKPSLRTHWFDSELVRRAGAERPKALLLQHRRDLDALLPFLEQHGTDCVLQQLVDGPETRIASYHAYVRPGGEVVAEFTGRKLRTSPRRHGASTYVEITDDADVRRAGRAALETLAFSGVVKMDFKRDADARLHLLEINPRFSLWHHAAAVAGVNLPALVYRDCLEPGSARAAGPVRPGVRWLSARADRAGLREHLDSGELTRLRWLWQLATATVDEDWCLRDPWPGLAALGASLRRRLQRWRRPARA